MFSIGIIEKRKSKKLYQWDLDRQIKVTAPDGIEVDEVHFAHQYDKEALVVKAKNADGELVANIPNILLQSSLPIKVWLVSEDQTVFSDILIVIQRAKPADYVYTETEILRFESLEERIKALEEHKKRIQMTTDDTEVELHSNTLYVFPEMSSLSITFVEPEDASIANEYRFIFQSGAIATTLIIPDTVKIPSSFSVDANKVYEISVLENCLTYQIWGTEG